MPKLIDQQEEQSVDSRASFDSNAYWGMRLEDNKPQLITVLTDHRRSLNSILHFVKSGKSGRYKLCEAKTYGKACKHCEAGGDEAKQTQMRSFLVYNHSVEGKTKDSKDGSKTYDINPLQVLQLRMGEGGLNFTQVKELNGDPDSYYDSKFKGEKSDQTPDPKKLKANALMFKENGMDEIFAVQRTNKNDKKSYPPLMPTRHDAAQKTLGRGDKIVKVPDEVREAVNSLSMNDLAPHYLAPFGLTEEEWELWELQPPAKGSRIGDKVEEDEKNSDKAKV
jgi:hypothetical protein